MLLNEIKGLFDRVSLNISKVLVGKKDTTDNVMVALLCGSHVLLEDLPGTGKTMLAKSLAKSIDGSFKRIQFTPDLLPSDLTGINYYSQKNNEFVYREGPLFANIILADEINRATPRTQSSLLECMEEHQVTVDGETRKVPEPFFVIATQNPVKTQGTFPLPEAQMDRFVMRLSMGRISVAESCELLDRFEKNADVTNINSVVSIAEIIEAQNSFTKIYTDFNIKRYIADICEQTANDKRIVMPVSPRGMLMLMRASQAKAVLSGREFVSPDDVRKMAKPVLAHRIMMNTHSVFEGMSAQEKIIEDILRNVDAPVEIIK